MLEGTNGEIVGKFVPYFPDSLEVLLCLFAIDLQEITERNLGGKFVQETLFEDPLESLGILDEPPLQGVFQIMIDECTSNNGGRSIWRTP